MNEMQQILEAIKRLEKGQESIIAVMATKTDLQNVKEELTIKIEAVKADTEAIRASLEVGAGSLSDDIKYLQLKIFKLEQETEQLKQASHTAK